MIVGWILILFTTVEGGSVATQVGPFADRPSCQAAGAAAKQVRNLVYVCVPNAPTSPGQ